MAPKKGFIPWNKGKVGVQEAWNKGVKGSTKGKALTPEKEEARKKKISEGMKKHGGYRIGSGRGKKGWYKGFFCDSSWELAFVIYCLDHNISIKRNAQKLPYVFEEKERSYIPDFIVNDKFVEIKGYKTKQWDAKLAVNPDIVVYYEEDLQEILQYVRLTYGNDFITLYE